MRISLFIPCFVDSLMPQVGIAVVRVLEKLGHEIHFPEKQTCCGQPPFNSGCHDEARRIAEHQLDCFRDAEVIVGPSGSCVAMMKKFYPELFAGRPREGEALAIAKKTWEFSEFLVDKLGVADVGAAFRGKVTFHDGCHGLRELKVQRQPRELLRHVMGLELVEMGEAASCCGFGGSFAVKFPKISTAMGGVKTKSIIETGAKTVVSCDPSCLLQIGGLLKKQGHDIACLHIAEVLEAS